MPYFREIHAFCGHSGIIRVLPPRPLPQPAPSAMGRTGTGTAHSNPFAARRTPLTIGSLDIFQV